MNTLTLFAVMLMRNGTTLKPYHERIGTMFKLSQNDKTNISNKLANAPYDIDMKNYIIHDSIYQTPLACRTVAMSDFFFIAIGEITTGEIRFFDFKKFNLSSEEELLALLKK